LPAECHSHCYLYLANSFSNVSNSFPSIGVRASLV
jgi:hypothetical protein